MWLLLGKGVCVYESLKYTYIKILVIPWTTLLGWKRVLHLAVLFSAIRQNRHQIRAGSIRITSCITIVFGEFLVRKTLVQRGDIRWMKIDPESTHFQRS